MTSSKPPPPTEDAAESPLVDLPRSEPLEQTIQWLVEGVREADVKAALKQSYPEADIDGLMLAAADYFAQSAELARTDAGQLLGWCLLAYSEIYRRTFEIGDFQGAAKAVKAIEAHGKECLRNAPPNHQPDRQADPQPTTPALVHSPKSAPQTASAKTKNAKRRPRSGSRNPKT